MTRASSFVLVTAFQRCILEPHLHIRFNREHSQPAPQLGICPQMSHQVDCRTVHLRDHPVPRYQTPTVCKNVSGKPSAPHRRGCSCKHYFQITDKMLWLHTPISLWHFPVCLFIQQIFIGYVLKARHCSRHLILARTLVFQLFPFGRETCEEGNL